MENRKVATMEIHQLFATQMNMFNHTSKNKNTINGQGNLNVKRIDAAFIKLQNHYNLLNKHPVKKKSSGNIVKDSKVPHPTAITRAKVKAFSEQGIEVITIPG